MTEVVCAVIRNSENHYLMVQRSENMSHPLSWEFPGGKVQSGETAEEAIIREIREELSLEVNTIQRLPRVEWEYSDKKIGLLPIICEIRSGNLQLHEHRSQLWLSLLSLPDLNILEPDRLIIHNILEAK